jgi:hypothetical protein
MGELRGSGIDSGRLVQLLPQSGRSGDLRRGRLNGLVSGSSGKLRLLSGDSRVRVLRHVDLLARRSLSLEEVLDLAAVVADVLLADAGNLLHLLGSNALDLGSLAVDELGSVVDLLIDELLVRGVDQRHNEGNGSTNEGKSPEGNELNKVVRNESSDESLPTVNITNKSDCVSRLTAAEAATFSAKMIRWASMTKKLMSSWTSPIRASRVSRGTV